MQQQIGKYLEDIELARGEVALENMGDVTLEKLKAKIVENGIVAEQAITDIIPSDGSEVTQAKILTKEGYIFVITASSSEYAGSGESILTPPEITEANIKLTYNSNNGKNETKTVRVNKGETLRLLENIFTKENCNFYGWNTSPTGSGISYTTGTTLTVNENLELYAMWDDQTAIYNQRLSVVYRNGQAIYPDTDRDTDQNRYSSGNFGNAARSALSGVTTLVGEYNSSEVANVSVPNVISGLQLCIRFSWNIPYDFCSETHLEKLLLCINGTDYSVVGAIESGLISPVVLWSGDIANGYIYDAYFHYPDAKKILFGDEWSKAGAGFSIVITPTTNYSLIVKTQGHCICSSKRNGCYTGVYRGTQGTLSVNK